MSQINYQKNTYKVTSVQGKEQIIEIIGSDFQQIGCEISRLMRSNDIDTIELLKKENHKTECLEVVMDDEL